jgi:hypothetical protein
MKNADALAQIIFAGRTPSKRASSDQLRYRLKKLEGAAAGAIG